MGNKARVKGLMTLTNINGNPQSAAIINGKPKNIDLLGLQETAVIRDLSNG